MKNYLKPIITIEEVKYDDIILISMVNEDVFYDENQLDEIF